jgi:ribosome maturation factor RimP
MYRDIAENLLNCIEPVARAHGLELVDVHWSKGSGRGHLRVVVDTPDGTGRVGVDDCARVSRELSHSPDLDAAIPSAYVLEVCSPGLDRVLAREVDFQRAIGQRVRLETREPIDGRRKFRGELVAFADGEVHLQAEPERVRIPFERIARANVVFTTGNEAARG